MGPHLRSTRDVLIACQMAPVDNTPTSGENDRLGEPRRPPLPRFQTTKDPGRASR